MAAKKGKCIHFGECSKADNREIVEPQAGEEFICSECGRPLQEHVGGAHRRTLLLVISLLTIVTGTAIWALWPRQSIDQAKATGDKVGQQPAQESIPCGLQPVSQPDVTRLLTYLKQGMTYASQNQYELALKEFEQVRQIDPNFLAMHENIAAAQLKLKELPEAENHLQAELKLIGCLEQARDAELPKFAYMLEVDRDGKENPDLARAQTMRQRLKQAKGVAHYNLACVRAREGAGEQSIAELRKAVESGFADTSALKHDPDLASVRTNPGFQDVVMSAASSRAPAGPK